MAIDELVSAAQQIKASKRLSAPEANYLVAYAIQYWELSAEQIGLHMVTTEVRDALHVEGPIVLSRVPRHLKRSFPLTAKFTGIEVID